jgi:hypothetical protein
MSFVYSLLGFLMIRNFVIRNFVSWEFCYLGALLLRNFVIRNFMIRTFVIRNFKFCTCTWRNRRLSCLQVVDHPMGRGWQDLGGLTMSWYLWSKSWKKIGSCASRYCSCSFFLLPLSQTMDFCHLVQHMKSKQYMIIKFHRGGKQYYLLQSSKR